MKIFDNKVLFTIGFYFWLIALVILTSMSYPDKMTTDDGTSLRWDYLEHFFLYLIIPILYFFAKGAFLRELFSKPYIILILGLLFASLTEVQQHFIEGRSFNPTDLYLNIGGYLSGIPIGKILFKKLTNL